MKYTQAIRNTSHLDVSFNELQTPQSLQRVLDRLYENDEALAELYRQAMGQFHIDGYDPAQEYQYGQLVWFLDSAKGLHVLRCDVNAVPAGSLSKYRPGGPSGQFAEAGWKDLNPKIDVLEEYGIRKVLEKYISSAFKAHSSDESLHPYGRLSYDESSRDALGKKVALRDVSNADPDREQTFFPYETIYLKPTDSIIRGFGRSYDNGLLEFDIVYRLSYAGHQEVDSEYGISADVLSCNCFDDTGVKQDSRYFHSVQDSDIFAPALKYESYESDAGDAREEGRNDYCNVYSAQLTFSQDSARNHRFADAGYMVFGSGVACQDRNTPAGAVTPSANAMMFARKTQTGFAAVYVTYPNQSNYGKPGYNARNGGLQQNSFHCHVVGRWK